MKNILSCTLFQIKGRRDINSLTVWLFLILMLSAFFTTSVYAVEVHSSDLAPSSDTKPLLTLGMFGQEVSISMAEIESLPLFDTEEMVHFDGPEGRFSGILLNDLLKKYGLYQVPRLRFSALDGYEVFMSKEVWQKNQFLMATRLNGEPISAEHLGPLLLIVPSDVGLDSHLTESKNYWVWALNEILIQ